MAAYNADIRIGITGKTGLNQLEKQLDRVNKDVIKLNKALSLKARNQTVKLNTKGATAQIKMLDNQLKKLGRTIKVNVQTKEPRVKEQQNSNTVIASGGNITAALAAALAIRQKQVRTQKELVKGIKSETTALEVNEKIRSQIEDIDSKIIQGREKLTDLNKRLPETSGRESFKSQLEGLQQVGAISKKTSDQFDKLKARVADLGPLDQGKEFKKFFDQLPQKAKNAVGKVDNLRRQQIQNTKNDLQGLNLRRAQLEQRSVSASAAAEKRRTQNLDKENDQRIAAEREFYAKRDRMNARSRLRDDLRARKAKAQATKQSAQQGAGLALATAAGSVPVLGQAVAGGLAASFTGGSVAAGALAGGVAGLGVAFVGVTADVTKFNNALLKQQRALANTVATNKELEQSLAAIERASDDFLVPVGQATEQFTKLNAAARSSGFTVSEVEEVYRGLSAANLALGGDAERLNGILLASQQIFSKGKVQAEELRGQLGERMSGAFAKFAESADLSTKQLDKALERGEVDLKDFVNFAKSLLEEYEENAKTISDAPENAAERLALNMDKLRRSLGPILTDMGNMFINLANTAVEQLTRMFDGINDFGVNNARSMRDEVAQGLEDAKKRRDEGIGSSIGEIIPFLSNDADVKRREENLERAEQALAKQIALRDERLGGLVAGGKPIKPQPITELEPPPTGGGGDKGPRDTVAEAMRERQELERILGLRQQITVEETELQAIQRQRVEREAELQREIGDIKADNLTAESKAAEIENAKLKAAIDQLGLTQQLKAALIEIAEAQEESSAAFQSEVADLELAIGLERAITEEAREQLELARAKAGIDARPELTDEQKNKLKGLEDQLSQARMDNTGISGYIKELKKDLTDTEAMIVSLAQTVETELSNAMSTALIGLIDGTKTAEEAFADMFKNIGAAFIQMATDMIAKALVMKALGILTGALGGGGGGGGDWTGPGGFEFSGKTGIYEGGGYTGNAPRSGGIDGKGGFPAILHPQETVIDHHGAMDRYSPGGGSAGGGSRTIYFQSEIINNVEYVTADQAMAMSRAAADDGAKRGAAGGHSRSMRTLQNSRSQRAKLGMS